MVKHSLSERAVRIERLLPRAAQSMFSVEDDPFAQLPLGQLRVLRQLEDGPKTPGQLASVLKLTAGAVSQLTNRLRVSNMLVERLDDEDRRMKWLDLSETGRELMRTRSTFRGRQAELILCEIPEELQVQLIEALESIVSVSERRASEKHHV